MMKHFVPEEGKSSKCSFKESINFLSSTLLPNRIVPKRIHCGLCDVAFSNQVAFLVHQIHHRLPPKNWLFCQDCKCVFPTECGFFTHDCLECKTNPKEAKKQCLLCFKLKTLVTSKKLNTKYSSNYDKNRSMKTKKPSNDVYICTDCDYKVFEEAGSALEEHIQSKMHFNIVPVENFDKSDLQIKDHCKELLKESAKALIHDKSVCNDGGELLEVSDKERKEKKSKANKNTDLFSTSEHSEKSKPNKDPKASKNAPSEILTTIKTETNVDNANNEAAVVNDSITVDSTKIKTEVPEIEEVNEDPTIVETKPEPISPPPITKIDYKCDTCEKSFSTLNDKEIHIAEAHKVPAKRFNCNQCEDDFESLKDLQRHKKSMHRVEKQSTPDASSIDNAKKKKKHQCEKCGNGYDTQIALYSHLVKVHPDPDTDEEPSFKCNTCEKEFKDKDDLQFHEKSAHSKSKKNKDTSKPTAQVTDLDAENEDSGDEIIEIDDPKGQTPKKNGPKESTKDSSPLEPLRSKKSSTPKPSQKDQEKDQPAKKSTPVVSILDDDDQDLFSELWQEAENAKITPVKTKITPEKSKISPKAKITPEKNQNHRFEPYPSSSNYKQKRSLWKKENRERHEETFFVCEKCKPFKILKGDIVGEHSSFHSKIYPISMYNRFDILVPDLRENKLKKISKKKK